MMSDIIDYWETALSTKQFIEFMRHDISVLIELLDSLEKEDNNDNRQQNIDK
jgi:hypothetical protein